MPNTDTLIPTAEVARIKGVHVRTVHRWVDKGLLVPAAKAPGIRGALLFRASDVDSLTEDAA